MKKISLLFILVFFCFTLKITAQEIKFGKVSKQELQEKFYPLDATAPAAILYKKRKTYYEYSSSTGFELMTKIHERIKIYNKDGLKWASKSIHTYQGNNLRESVSIKAVTYSLENNKIVKEKLKKKNIFKEKSSKYWNDNKFTMPNVKVGSVIEWEYTIRSPFTSNIEDVIFQYKIPVKKIKIRIEIPQYFSFKYQPNFYYPINIVSTTKNRTLHFQYSSRTGNETGLKTSVKRGSKNITEQVYLASENNIPAITEEPYINNINNYIAKVHFEHTSTQLPGKKIKYYTNNWNSVAKTIYKSTHFGVQIERANFLKADILNQITGITTDKEKAFKLFQFIKTQIKWNGIYGKYTDKGIKKAYKEHAGNVADINLCLVAMLKEAGLKANPVLISTKKHGIPLFPTLDGFNYVVAAVEFPQGIVLFDATDSYSVPNVLPNRALNWQGRLVKHDGSSNPINLFLAQPAKERVTLFVKMDSEGGITGLKRSSYYANNALNYRNKKAFLTEKNLQSKLEKENSDIEIIELKISNKKNLSKPILESFKFEAEDLCDVINDKIYFSPLLILANSKNPFTQEKRLYPVDFGTAWEDQYIVSIRIPDGYGISSLPENMAIGLPENMGVFKFVISKKGDNKIQVLASTKINTPIISSIYYKDLKNFYKAMLEKQTEKVVLTKL
ncbi:MAG: DUF3857 domain-containing protein [Flavobacteriaceae bacterium]|nr:DUF3857 domain-containing protein [Flavobacteriaceae bacterium]